MGFAQRELRAWSQQSCQIQPRTRCHLFERFCNCLNNTFQFANAYANGEGMKHYVNMVQEPEFAARDKGYTFVSHQQEVGAGYFDDVTTVIQGGSSSVKALSGSTEEEQFH